MELTKNSPIKCDIVPIPESAIMCEFKTKALKKETKTKTIKNEIKINVDIVIYYQNPDHYNMVDVTTSGVQSVYISKEDRFHSLKLDIPKFENKRRKQSYVIISLDNEEDPYIKVYVEDITVENIAQHIARKKDEENKTKTSEERIKARIDTAKNGEINVVCEGLMFGHSGFAKAMRNVAFGLYKLGCNVTTVVLDEDNINYLGTEKGSKINKLRRNPLIIDQHFWITMNNSMGIGKHEDCYSIGYAMFETECFPTIYAEHLKKQNEIWTPSNFCRDSMITSGLKKVFVMPLGVDTEMFSPEKIGYMKCPDEINGKYKFLTICGYSERKGVSILVRAFAEEFVGDNKVALYLKGGWYPLEKAKKEISDMIKDIQNPPTIYLDFNIYPDSTLAQIYKMCDCFVLPSRGEGFSLPLCEAMSMGMPTIGTKWSGNLDFMNSDNSYLVDIDGVGTEPRCNWVCQEYVGGRFAIPNKDHLRQLMRHVYKNRKDAEEKGMRAREHITNNFSWEVSCKKMYERLKTIIQEDV